MTGRGAQEEFGVFPAVLPSFPRSAILLAENLLSENLIYNRRTCHSFPAPHLPHSVMVAQVTLNHFV